MEGVHVMLFNNEDEWRNWLKRQQNDETCFSRPANQPEKYPCWSVDWYYGDDLRWRSIFLYDQAEVSAWHDRNDKKSFGEKWILEKYNIKSWDGRMDDAKIRKFLLEESI